jgi:hypothetical protein
MPAPMVLPSITLGMIPQSARQIAPQRPGDTRPRWAYPDRHDFRAADDAFYDLGLMSLIKRPAEEVELCHAGQPST